jgi:hypothetical protein
MDPASTIAGLIGFAATIVPPVVAYISNIKDAPRAAESLADEVYLLQEVLGKYSSSGIFDQGPFDRSTVFVSTVEMCRTSLEDLRHRLLIGPEGQKLVRLFRRLKWPMDESRTRESIVSLHRYTALFNLFLTSHGL